MTTILNWKWVETNSPTATQRTDDIWFFDANHGWLVNNNGQVAETMDGGQTWTERYKVNPNAPGYPWLRSMGWANEQVGWFGAFSEFSTNKDYLDVLLHKTTDGGRTWTPVKNMPQNSPSGVCGMSVFSDTHMIGAGKNDPTSPGPSGVVVTTDGGQSWQMIDLSDQADNLIDVYFFDEKNGLVVGGKKDPTCPPVKEGYKAHPEFTQLKAVVLRTTDGGQTWTNVAASVQGLACGEWGWKIQFLTPQIGYVALENFTSAAILLTEDGGHTWVRRDVKDASGNIINQDLEGIGFVSPGAGWVGGWGKGFDGLLNSATNDGGKTWVEQNHDPQNPGSDPRVAINRYRIVGDPVEVVYCSGKKVYKALPPEKADAERVAMAAAGPDVAPAHFSMSYQEQPSAGTVTISYTLPEDARSVWLGIWNHFVSHKATLVDGDPKKAGRHHVVWDGTFKDGSRAWGGTAYFARLVVNGDEGETLTFRVPDPV